MTSTRKRLEKGIAALQSAIARLRLSREIERIIGGNGRPPEALREEIGRAE